MTYTPIAPGTDPWDALVNAAFTDQDSRITTNTGDIASNASDIAGVSSSLGTTNSNVTNLQNSLAVTNANVSGNSTNISTLQSQMSAAQTDILGKVNKTGDTMSGTLNGTVFSGSGTSQLTNLRLGSGGSFGGSNGGVLLIPDVTTPPSTNPSSGAVFYVESGNPKTRDSGGRVLDGTRNWQNTPGPSPADNGLISWNYDPESQNGGNSITLGTVFIHKLWIPANATINTIGVVVSTAGSALTYARAGIYNAAGSQLAISNDQTGTWNSTGGKACTLSGPLLITTAGYYYVALLTTGTTAPVMTSTPGSSNAFNFNTSGASLRHATGPTGQTSLPASITMSSNVSTGSSIWCCVY